MKRMLSNQRVAGDWRQDGDWGLAPMSLKSDVVEPPAPELPHSVQEQSLPMSSSQKMFKRIQSWIRRWRFREGKTLSRFIACDIRRDILIISAARVDDGIISGRVRTTNVLYLSGGLIPEPEFEPARELRIDEMWHWTGKSWGGLPDGTSIVDRVHRERSD
jgi:hypothetical protein